MRVLAVLVLCLALALPAWAASRPVVAVIVGVQGKASVLLHKASKQPRAARFGQRLRTEALLEVPAGSRVTLAFYQGGSEVTLTGPMKAEVEPARMRKVEGSGAISEPIRGRLDLPAAPPEPVPGGTVLRGRTTALAGAALVQVLWSDRPDLKWQEVPGATYQVRFSTPEGAELASFESASPGLEGRVLVAKLGGPLEWGRDYIWEVTARRGDRVEGRSSRLLRVLSREDAATAEGALRKTTAERAGRLAVAERLAGWGLWEEALALYEELLSEEPDNPALRSRTAEACSRTGRPGRARDLEPREGEE